MFPISFHTSRIVVLSLIIGSMMINFFFTERDVFSAGVVPCAFVLNSATSVDTSYCIISAPVGSSCNGDNAALPSNTGGYYCENRVSNPVQSAIDRDNSGNKYKTLLDSGVFEIFDYQNVSFNWKIGIHVPSNIIVEGTKDANGAPLSTIKLASSLSSESPLDVVVLVFGNKTDPNVAVTNSAFNSVFIDANYRANTGLLAGKAQNFMSFYWLKVQHTKLSGVNLGFVNQYENIGEGVAKIYEFNGYSELSPNIVHACQISDVGGDGLVVVGRYARVEYCDVRNATASISNGIGTFSNSSYIVIENNTISNARTGIGIDGSFPAYCPEGASCRRGILEYNYYAAEKGAGKLNGYAALITIRNNHIDMPALEPSYGISLWRNFWSRVSGNVIQSNDNRGVGIKLNESDSNFVWSNTVNNVDVGVHLYSAGYSRKQDDGQYYGTSYNGVGLNPLFVNIGNDLTQNRIGIKLEKTITDTAHIKQNTVRNNDLRFDIQACDYSGSNPGLERQYASDNLSDNLDGGVWDRRCNYPANSYTQGP